YLQRCTQNTFGCKEHGVHQLVQAQTPVGQCTRHLWSKVCVNQKCTRDDRYRQTHSSSGSFENKQNRQTSDDQLSFGNTAELLYYSVIINRPISSYDYG